ncbi:DUF932 domain-containing protein [Saccharospirillum alexandrii]|uniref:DUF932 domain-containing protein n=1 Tax=Saccharospirillum alexandrii TaxID=2448477 RepID=UPI0037357B97
MAHLVETMAYTGKTPWHGLGNSLSPNQPLEVWADQAGMNWQIKESDVCFIAGNSGYLGEIHPFSDNKVLYRSDSKEPLSVVSQRYKVVQPGEILEFYRDLTEKSGFELETAGVLKGGRKLWALARTGQSGNLRGVDQTDGYVLLATACDGSMATTAQFTSVRVVCNNTLAIALKDKAASVKVRHNTQFDAQQVKQQLGISVSAWDDYMYQLKALSERKVNARDVTAFLEAVYSDVAEGNRTTVSERALSRSLELFEGRGMGAELVTSKNTAYGLLNAVTEYVDHEQRARNSDYRLDSAWFGKGASTKQKALDQALKLVA